jgi:hypothetical protein
MEKGKVGHRVVVADLLMNEEAKIFVEIGVFRGALLRKLLWHCGDFIEQYWAIDPWIGETSGMGKKWPQANWDGRYFNMCLLMMKYPQLRVIRSTSLKAAELARRAGKKFCMAFIDACHDEERVKEDIVHWKPLIKKGGLLTGHDYMPATSRLRPGVKKAVDELLGAGNIELFPARIWVYRC